MSTTYQANFHSSPNNEVKEKLISALEKAGTMSVSELFPHYELARHERLYAEQAEFGLLIGQRLFDSQQYLQSLEKLEESLLLFKQENAFLKQAESNRAISNLFSEIGQFRNALNHDQASLKLNKQLGNQTEIFRDYERIGNVYLNLVEYDEAVSVFHEGLRLSKLANDETKIMRFLYKLGNAYNWNDQLNEAESFLDEAKMLADSKHEDLLRDQILVSLAIVYRKRGEVEKGKNFFIQVIENCKRNKNDSVLVGALRGLGNLFNDLGDHKMASIKLNEAIEICEEGKIPNHKVLLLGLCSLIHKVYLQLGEFQKAYLYFNKFYDLQQEMNANEIGLKMRYHEFRIQIESARREKEISEHKTHLKEMFLANMSHEIRTPINAVIGMANLLLQQPYLPPQTKYLTAIKKSGDNLLAIVNDILDFSKIEAGKLDIEVIEFNLQEVLDMVYQTMRFKAEERGLELKIRKSESLPNHLVGDPSRLSQVLINLVGNSIKFTSKGKVEITARELGSNKNESGNSVTVQFTIEDTGIGISADKFANIFESFTQAGSDTSRKFGGTGLGLTISKQLIELQNGKIWLESEVGKGTTFFFNITYSIASEETKVIDAEEIIPVEKLNGKKILLVEDNDFNKIVAKETLETLIPGIKIDTAENGIVAVKMNQEISYDLILMDVQMPEMNGYEATREIRKQTSSASSKVPIMAMTANVSKEEVDRCLSCGMNNYISKPFLPNDLLKKVATLILT